MKTALGWCFALWLVLMGAPRAAVAQTYKVGVAAPITGPRAADGAAISRAVERFEAEHPNIDVVLQDDAGDPAMAPGVARALADEGVLAAVGHAGDAAAAAAAPVYKASNLPFIATDASDRAIALTSDRTYSAAYSDDVEAKRIVAYAVAVLGATNLAVLSADDPHSAAVSRAVQRAAQGIGLPIRDTATWQAATGPSDTFAHDMYPSMPAASAPVRRARWFGPRRSSDAAKRMGVDAFVVIGGGAAGPKIVSELRRSGVDVPVIGNDRWDAAELATAREFNVHLTAGHTWDIQSLEAREWHAAFPPDAPPTLAALYTYEALQIVAAAVDGGATDAEGVATFLAGLRDADTAVPGLTSLLYFDADGVMQRDPWFLTVYSGRLRPAFTQLRVVVDPRARWRALRYGAAPPPPPPPPTEPASADPAAPPAAPSPEDDARDARRAERERARQLELAQSSGSRPGAFGAPKGDQAVAAAGDRRVVRIGEEAYHLTSVVFTGIDYYRVDDVNVAEHSFEVELFLWLTWQGDADIENIGFLNQIFTEESQKEVLRQDLDGDVKYVCYKIKARFLTPFDLHHFPFDQQELPITLSHPTRDSRDLLLVVDYDHLSDAELEAIYPEEWTYLGRADFSATYEPTTTFGDPAYQGRASASAFSVYESHLVLNRILFPYLVKLFLPLGIMVAVSLFVFLVPPKQFDARMTLVMTALLSILVFHLSQEDRLPSVGYLMRSDEYFMVTYVLLFVLIVKTVAVNAVYERAETLVRWFERLFGLLFVALTLLVYFWLTVRPTS